MQTCDFEKKMQSAKEMSEEYKNEVDFYFKKLEENQDCMPAKCYLEEQIAELQMDISMNNSIIGNILAIAAIAFSAVALITKNNLDLNDLRSKLIFFVMYVAPIGYFYYILFRNSFKCRRIITYYSMLDAMRKYENVTDLSASKSAQAAILERWASAGGSGAAGGPTGGTASGGDHGAEVGVDHADAAGQSGGVGKDFCRSPRSEAIEGHYPGEPELSCGASIAAEPSVEISISKTETADQIQISLKNRVLILNL